MSEMSFTTAKKERGPSGNTLQRFDLDGEGYAAARPKDEAFLLIVEASSKQASLGDQVYSTMQFLNHCFEPAAVAEALAAEAPELDDDPYAVAELCRSGARLRDRLMDRNDDMDQKTLSNIMQSLVETWTGTPTGSPRDSSLSPATPGRKSTARSGSKASIGSTSSAKPRRAR